MSRYLWPAMVAVCFLLAALTIPYGQPFDWSEKFLPTGLFIAFMFVFGGLWMWDGRWGG